MSLTRRRSAGALPSGRRVAPIAGIVALALTGCVVGPDYHRPPTAVPAVYKEAVAPGWQRAHPADAIDRGAWWSIYRDPVLDRLERQIDISNQNLKSAEAAFREAEAIVAEARAGYFPSLTANASAQRSRNPSFGAAAIPSSTTLTTVSAPTTTGTTPTGTATTTAPTPTSGTPGGAVTVPVSGGAGGATGAITNSFVLNEAASWTPDLWGRIHRLVESDIATAQASAGDLASARLAAQGQLASDYMQLRVADELQRLLADSVKAYTESLRITRNQYRGGTADQSAVSQAEAQLESTRAQLIAVGVTRAQLEHAIAVLIGRPPADFSIAPTTGVIAIPDVPPELPSALLQRRPDIAAAERQMAATNAQIGVAAAAFFPDVTLSAESGVSSSMLSRLLSASSRSWSLGGNLVQTIFDGGLNQAALEQQRFAFDATVANYRQTVLTGFQQVEDELAALRILAAESTAQGAAVAAAREAERIINNQYKAGTVAYTSVIVAEATALADAETAVNIRQSRLVASVALIQALGGGWDVSQLPSADRIEQDVPLNFSPIPPADTWPKFLKFW